MRDSVPAPNQLPDDPVESDSPVTWRCHGLRALSIVLFLTSLGAGGIRTDPVERDFSNGFSLLLIGWLGMLKGVVAWVANPCLILTWIMMCSRSLLLPAMGFCAIAFGFAASMLFHETVPEATASGYRPLIIVSLGQAYWFWIASTAVAALGIVWEMFRPLVPSQIAKASPTSDG